MKRIIIYGVTLMLSTTTAFFIGRAGKANIPAQNANRQYPLSSVVKSIHDDTVTVETINGMLWSFTNDTEDWYEGDICAMIMDNNGTPDYMYDDIIVKTRYSGFIKAGDL